MFKNISYDDWFFCDSSVRKRAIECDRNIIFPVIIFVEMQTDAHTAKHPLIQSAMANYGYGKQILSVTVMTSYMAVRKH